MSARTTSAAAWRRRLLGAALTLALAGCASTPDIQHAILPMPKPLQAEVTPAAEREHQRILAAYGGVYENARVQQMVELTVARLVKASERPELQYKVTILNSAAINAFALPNGQLYVTRGLVALANDKSELASVLAHEMGHVIARHAEIREEQARDDAVATRAISDVVKDPDMSALSLAKSKLKLATFSRAQEFEADGIGVGITARAGFDPYGAARMLTALQRNANLASPNAGSDLHTAEFMSSHPATDDRVKNALANARQFAAPGAGERDRAEYLAGLDGLIFGEDSSEGFVRGRRFLHAKLGFTFMAPPGFTLDNTAQAVLGLKDGGREALRVDVVSVPAEQSLSDYLVSGWMENVAPASVQAFSVNGFPAATATAAGKDWSFRLYTVRFGSDVYRFIFAAKSRTPQADRAFRESIDSFRRMSLKESAEVKPLRLKIVTVGANDTVQSLAQRMAVADHKLARFLTLNGLSPHERPKPGSKVKMVVE